MNGRKIYRSLDEALAVYQRNVRNHGVSAGVRKGHDDEGDYWYLGVELDSYDAPIRSRTAAS